MGSPVLSQCICYRKASKRRVPKVHHEQLYHNYLKMQSHLVLQYFIGGRTPENGQVRQIKKFKCNRKRQKSLPLQSLMQGDSGSQYPKNVWGREEGEWCATETLFSDGMKREGI